jgi:predicted GNAT family N-acyltransferase
MGCFRLTTVDEIILTSPGDDAQWDAYFELRWRLLRKPWQQPPGSEKDDREQDAYHCIAMNMQQQVIGVGRIHKHSDQVAQIRYMAVTEEYQRRGIGKKILKHLETIAYDWKIKQIVLNARDPYLDFYLADGYFITDKRHVLFDVIPHTQLQKELTDN